MGVEFAGIAAVQLVAPADGFAAAERRRYMAHNDRTKTIAIVSLLFVAAGTCHADIQGPLSDDEIISISAEHVIDQPKLFQAFCLENASGAENDFDKIIERFTVFKDREFVRQAVALNSSGKSKPSKKAKS